ncbi:MAG: S1 family peptidase, partial [Planctomycetota bacterium]
MNRRIPLLILFLALFVTIAHAATPPDFCVRVFVADKDGSHSMGSGTLLAPNLIVTNWHVVRDNRRGTAVKILFPDWSVSAGYVVLVDKAWDIAAISIPRVKVKPATLGDPPKKGDRLTVHGYGMGLPAQSTGTLGHFRAPNQKSPPDFVQI